jgi:hypothetical protein
VFHYANKLAKFSDSLEGETEDPNSARISNIVSSFYSSFRMTYSS